MPNDTRILAVDDREENLTALAAVLDAMPVEVVPVTSGQAALKELLNDDFALILLDVVMPEMDGFETAEHIKSRPRTRDIPIIFLTAGGSAGEQAYRGYAAGAVDYLTKPFDPWLLRAKVSVFVDLHRRNTELRQQARLLRSTLGGDDAGSALAGCERLLAALDERLAKVEGDVARLRSGEPADALAEHVGELRLALDAFSAGS
ncbi:response regulator [Actinomadura bangladeshensis]|uniref:response regulator n=1 Tax=Actinomadura bangladeshensis TaxID=453573 RepID=UPI001FB7565B|nr:response regulator [Actinomadura bangladeshensis]